MNRIKDILFDIEQEAEQKDLTFLEAIVDWCEKNNVEVELLAVEIRKNEKYRIKMQLEAERLNYIKKEERENRLDV